MFEDFPAKLRFAFEIHTFPQVAILFPQCIHIYYNTYMGSKVTIFSAKTCIYLRKYIIKH